MLLGMLYLPILKVDDDFNKSNSNSDKILRPLKVIYVLVQFSSKIKVSFIKISNQIFISLAEWKGT